jgi:HSP20 family protein
MSHGTLTIRAQRHEETRGRLHSEFRYGTFTGSLTRPAGADEASIEAVYDNGILEISAVISENADDTTSRTIPVRLHQHITPT